jgi:hypothetical protein
LDAEMKVPPSENPAALHNSLLHSACSALVHEHSMPHEQCGFDWVPSDTTVMSPFAKPTMDRKAMIVAAFIMILFF